MVRDRAASVMYSEDSCEPDGHAVWESVIGMNRVGNASEGRGAVIPLGPLKILLVSSNGPMHQHSVLSGVRCAFFNYLCLCLRTVVQTALSALRAVRVGCVRWMLGAVQPAVAVFVAMDPRLHVPCQPFLHFVTGCHRDFLPPTLTVSWATCRCGGAHSVGSGAEPVPVWYVGPGAPSGLVPHVCGDCAGVRSAMLCIW
jgi:hypothetical protein